MRSAEGGAVALLCVWLASACSSSSDEPRRTHECLTLGGPDAGASDGAAGAAGSAGASASGQCPAPQEAALTFRDWCAQSPKVLSGPTQEAGQCCYDLEWPVCSDTEPESGGCSVVAGDRAPTAASPWLLAALLLGGAARRRRRRTS